MAKTHRKLTRAEKIAASNEAALTKAKQMAAAAQPQAEQTGTVIITTTGILPNGETTARTSTIPEQRFFMNDPHPQSATTPEPVQAAETKPQDEQTAPESQSATTPEPTTAPESAQAETVTAEAAEMADEKSAKKAAKAAKKAAKETEKAAKEAAEEAKRAKKRAKTMPSRITGTRMDTPIAMALLFA